MGKIIDIDNIIQAIDMAYEDGVKELKVDINDLVALANEIVVLKERCRILSKANDELEETIAFLKNIIHTLDKSNLKSLREYRNQVEG